MLDDGRIENVYTIRIVNKDSAPHDLKLRAEGLPQGGELDFDAATIRVEGGNVLSLPVRLRVPAKGLHGSIDVELFVESADGDITTSAKTRFIAPLPS